MSRSHRAITDRAATWSSRPIVVTLQGPQGKRAYLIDKPFARVGAHPHSEIVLPDGPAKRFYLHATTTGIYCLNLECSPVGRPPFNGWMPPRRAISMGAYQVNARFADDSPDQDRGASRQASTPAAVARPQLELSTVNGRRQTVQLRLRRPLTIVGREPPSKLCLADPSISRAHCILYWDDEHLWGIDLFSANGVLIDGRPVEFGIVHPGSRLVLGNIMLTHLSTSLVSQPLVSQSQEDDPEPGTTSVLPVQLAVISPDAQVVPADEADEGTRGPAGYDDAPAGYNYASVGHQSREPGERIDNESRITQSHAIGDRLPTESTVLSRERQELMDHIASLEEQLKVARLSRPFDEQESHSGAPSAVQDHDAWETIVDELRREAQQQAEEWVERRDALLAELAAVRAELAEATRDRELAQSRQRQAEQTSAEISARLLDLEQAHLVLERQFAAASRREGQQLPHRTLEEATTRREAEDREAEDRVVQRQLVEWQAERKRLIDELVRPLCGELSAAAPEIADASTAAAIGNANDLVTTAPPSDAPPSDSPRCEANPCADGAAKSLVSPRCVALVPASSTSRKLAGWFPPVVVPRSADKSLFFADSADATLDRAGMTVDSEKTQVMGPISSLPPVRISRHPAASRTSAAGEDALFDQLVSAQARRARAQGRRRLLALAAIGGAVVLALAAGANWAWQPLVRLLGL